MSELMRIYHDPPNTKAINKVISLFKNGGIVIFPSDTVYAMGCVASNKKAVERMRTIHRGKIASTVIDLTVYPPEVIREGLGSIDFI